MGRGRREAGRDSCVVFCDISNVPFSASRARGGVPSLTRRASDRRGGRDGGLGFVGIAYRVKEAT
jgi:hypothetical protein